jgi:hypothetical protein
MANGSMNAVRFHGKHDLRYEEIPIPDIKPGQVKIKPEQRVIGDIQKLREFRWFILRLP